MFFIFRFNLVFYWQRLYFWYYLMYRFWLRKIFTILSLKIYRIGRLIKKNINISIVIVNYIYPLLIDCHSVLYLWLLFTLKMCFQNTQHGLGIGSNFILLYFNRFLLFYLVLLNLFTFLIFFFLLFYPPIVFL